MEFSETDRAEAEAFCSDISRIANELASDPNSQFQRTPNNPNLTRAVVYNLMLQRTPCRPVKVEPMKFALDLLFAHRGLYGGPIAVLEGNSEHFNVAFFDNPSSTWPLFSTWEHTWHVIGPENLYPDMEFDPTREYCLLEDSKFFGTRAQTNQVKVSSTSVVAVPPGDGPSAQEVLERSHKRDEKFAYHSRLPSGHIATIQLEIYQGRSTLDYRVHIYTDEGSEGLGTKNWKVPREISTGELLAMILNEHARVIRHVWDEPEQRSPVDLWLQLESGGQKIGMQVTTIEPPELYSGLARQEKISLIYERTDLLELIRKALDRKRTQSSSGIHLLLDCGFLIPSSDTFANDVRNMIAENPLNYQSIWLVGRIDKTARCVFGVNPF